MAIADLLRFVARHPLNRNHHLRALARFAGWQVRTRINHGPVVRHWVNNSMFYATRGETGVTGNIYVGLDEWQDMGLLLHLLRPGDLFVDVGANSGSYTILAGAAAGARVIAFEPILSTYERLMANVRLNHLDGNCRYLNAAVGSAPGSLRMTCDRDSDNHVLRNNEQQEQTTLVPVVSLDEALADEAPLCMKIDVQGYESAVLAGAQSTLRRELLRVIVIEFGKGSRAYGSDRTDLRRSVEAFGFVPYSYDPWTRTLAQLSADQWTAPNVLFVRDLPWVAERIETAPRFSILGQHV